MTNFCTCNHMTYLSSRGGTLAKWVWPSLHEPLRGQSHLPEGGVIEVHMKILGNPPPALNIKQGQSQEEWLQLKEVGSSN